MHRQFRYLVFTSFTEEQWQCFSSSRDSRELSSQRWLDVSVFCAHNEKGICLTNTAKRKSFFGCLCTSQNWKCMFLVCYNFNQNFLSSCFSKREYSVVTKCRDCYCYISYMLITVFKFVWLKQIVDCVTQKHMDTES